jgi:hypothetical protein
MALRHFEIFTAGKQRWPIHHLHDLPLPLWQHCGRGADLLMQAVYQVHIKWRKAICRATDGDRMEADQIVRQGASGYKPCSEFFCSSADRATQHRPGRANSMKWKPRSAAVFEANKGGADLNGNAGNLRRAVGHRVGRLPDPEGHAALCGFAGNGHPPGHHRRHHREGELQNDCRR